MGGEAKGNGPRGDRRSIRRPLIAYAIALFACLGVIRVASPAEADSGGPIGTALSTDWPDTEMLREVLPAAGGDLSQYLIGGSAATDGEFPWMTFMIGQEPSGSVVLCGGTLVAPTFVLTAAHCVDTVERAVVVVGRNTLPTSATDPSIVAADVKYLYPTYVTDGAQGDVALLRLIAPATVPVVALAHPEDTAQSAAGVMASLAGWGITAPNGQVSETLQKASMPIRSTAECTAANRFYIEASNVCAGYLTADGPAATGACSGDSGGPLLVPTSDSRTRIQVGTVSYGPESGCIELDKPVVYMRVSFYLSWIELITGDLAGPPPTTTTTTTIAPPNTDATSTTTTSTTTSTSTTTTTVVTPAPVTTIANAASFAAPPAQSSGGSGGSSTLAATGSSGWITTEFVAWAVVVLILGRIAVLVARRPAVR